MADYEDRPLIGYLPNILKEVREFKAIMSGEQPEIFNMFGNIQTALDNQFVATATEYGVKRWESILGIVPPATDTLEDRKYRITQMFTSALPYTYKRLLAYLESETLDYTAILTPDEYKLFVRAVLPNYSRQQSLYDTLRRMIPANIVLFHQSGIAQQVDRPPLVVASGMVAVNWHRHIPLQGG